MKSLHHRIEVLKFYLGQFLSFEEIISQPEKINHIITELFPAVTVWEMIKGLVPGRLIMVIYLSPVQVIYAELDYIRGFCFNTFRLLNLDIGSEQISQEKLVSLLSKKAISHFPHLSDGRYVHKLSYNELQKIASGEVGTLKDKQLVRQFLKQRFNG